MLLTTCSSSGLGHDANHLDVSYVNWTLRRDLTIHDISSEVQFINASRVTINQLLRIPLSSTARAEPSIHILLAEEAILR